MRIRVKRWSYVRAYVTIAAGRRTAIQSITAAIVDWSEWHGITTVDWFSVRLSLCSDGKYHRLWAWGPSWGGHDRTCTWAGCPGAVRCRAVHPIRGVATRSVGRPQSDSVSTFNGGISVNCQSENRIMNSYFNSRVYYYDRVQRWWQNQLISVLFSHFHFFKVGFNNYPDTVRKFVTLNESLYSTMSGYTSSWSKFLRQKWSSVRVSHLETNCPKLLLWECPSSRQRSPWCSVYCWKWCE